MRCGQHGLRGSLEKSECCRAMGSKGGNSRCLLAPVPATSPMGSEDLLDPLSITQNPRLA